MLKRMSCMIQSRGTQRYSLGDVVTLVDPVVGSGMPRPALVLADTGDDDIVVARITTHLPRDSFDVSVNDWPQASLDRPSVVRPHKLATIKKSRVNRNIGILSNSDLGRVKDSFRRLGIVE